MQLTTALLFLASVSAVAGKTLRGLDSGQDDMLGERVLKSSTKSSRSTNSHDSTRTVHVSDLDHRGRGHDWGDWDHDRIYDRIEDRIIPKGRRGYDWDHIDDRAYWDRSADYCGADVVVTLKDLKDSTRDCADWIQKDIYQNFPAIRIYEQDSCSNVRSGDVRCISIDEHTIDDYNKYVERTLADIARALPGCRDGSGRVSAQEGRVSHWDDRAYWDRSADYCDVVVALKDMQDSTLDCADLIEEDIYRRFKGTRIVEQDSCSNVRSLTSCIPIDASTIYEKQFIERTLDAIGRAGCIDRRL